MGAKLSVLGLIIPFFLYLRSAMVKFPFSEPFPPTALRRRHAETVSDITSSYKIHYIIVIKNFLNPEGHQNPISGSKVKALLLTGLI